MKLIHGIPQSAATVLSIVSWLGKIVWNFAERTSNIISLAKSVVTFIPTIVEMFKSIFERFQAWKKEKDAAKKLEDELKAQQACLDITHEQCASLHLLQAENQKTKNALLELNKKNEKAKNDFKESLKKSLHKIAMGALYITAGAMLLSPVTFGLGILAFSALTTYDTVFGLFSEREDLNQADFDKKNAESITPISHQIEAPVPTRKKTSFLLMMLTAAIIGIGITAITVLTGPIGGIIFACLAGLISLGMIMNKRRSLADAFKAPEENSAEEKPSVEVFDNEKQENIAENTLENKVQLEPEKNPGPGPVKEPITIVEKIPDKTTSTSIDIHSSVANFSIFHQPKLSAKENQPHLNEKNNLPKKRAANLG